MQPLRAVLIAVGSMLFLAGCGGGSRDDVGYEYSNARPAASLAEFPEDAYLQDRNEFNTEAYDRIYENAFLSAVDHPLSTFAIDVDTASYANTRRFLANGTLPPAGAVRIEELINYFHYDYPSPQGELPFSVNVSAATCPWQAEHRLVRIGLKGREVAEEDRPASNIVFLLDVSGSMSDWNKLPLVKSSLLMLLDRLDARDRIAIVVYAGSSGLVLPSTSAAHRHSIGSSLNNLTAGGSTNGGSGIQLAYDVAAANFIEGGVNRVILCTDGDFNVGMTNQSSLVRLIEQKAESGVFLSVLGFGMGNYKDSTVEKLADCGNGNYAYIDSQAEAEKVLVRQMTGTLITIAKDVKIQVDFNPAHVEAYRLIGYENRLLDEEDFEDDQKDAGEIGAGHTVTALYEIVPTGSLSGGIASGIDPSKYQTTPQFSDEASSGELLTVRLRYKAPDGTDSQRFDIPIPDEPVPFEQASADFRFAAAVASFGMLLRDSQHRGNVTYSDVYAMASDARGFDPHEYRAEFLELVRQAADLTD